ncbi:phosphotransferase [Pontibacillus yanchengensis]|uniref:Phosphotransferase n=1 Tax=Pontibacillus yanchengensis TaxID=462910 RepID=A0ACC7VFA3_9BACI|nr:phosphotransferase [Pontibacillus yanchengensis]MYL53377.1 phosphotransferase [Pontibacillus yanchengensis]
MDYTQLGKGNVYQDFPFSFFKEKGSLDIHQIEWITPHVCKIFTHQGNYVTKRYPSMQVVRQQWEFFNSVSYAGIIPFVPFPSGRFTVYDGIRYIWTLSPWQDGTTLTFENKKDRHDAQKALILFHTHARGIQINSVQQRSPLYVKWQKRYHQFALNEHIFAMHNEIQLFREICLFSTEALQQFKSMDWDAIIKLSNDVWEWNHGDVASHNFLRTTDNHIKLIDFDLLTLGPQCYDRIQLAHRFISKGISVDEFILLDLFRDHLTEESFYKGVVFPSWILREWNVLLQKNPSNEQIFHWLEKVQNWWHLHQTFVAQLTNVLT